MRVFSNLYYLGFVVGIWSCIYMFRCHYLIIFVVVSFNLLNFCIILIQRTTCYSDTGGWFSWKKSDKSYKIYVDAPHWTRGELNTFLEKISRVVTFEIKPETLKCSCKILKVLCPVVIFIRVKLNGQRIGFWCYVLNSRHDGATMSVLLVLKTWKSHGSSNIHSNANLSNLKYPFLGRTYFWVQLFTFKEIACFYLRKYYE